MNSRGFTLTELMVVIVLLGTLTAFVIPQYAEALKRAIVRDAINQLLSLYAANQLYSNVQESGFYWDALFADPTNVADINAGLNIKLIEGDLDFDYVPIGGFLGVRAYTATARRTVNGNVDFEVQIDESPLDGTNPCCSQGDCLILNAC